MSVRIGRAVLAAFVVVLPGRLVMAQSAAAPARQPAASAGVAPAVPMPPETVTRTSDGQVIVRAVRLSEPLRVDGRLDEAVYSATPSVSDFIQQDPREGEPASEKTEAWIFFDNRNIYISGRCWDSHPERDIANDLRRDGNNILQNENFGLLLDTFHDKRNGFVFNANSIGGMRDLLITDETNSNADWNAVWNARVGTFNGGWTIEIAIPFKSLRYPSGKDQIWGVNLRRVVRWKNEMSYMTRIPAYLGIRGLFSVGLAGTLVGIEPPSAGRNIELKPYGISGLRTDRKATPPFSGKVNKSAGLDAKYGVSKSLTLDVTYNTDFAQVEDDTQQVNLTRFNQFFPEKREFFLEGQGIFAFGGAGNSFGGGNSNTPILFFSRRIGLSNGLPVPIAGGERLTGRAGKYSIGLLDIQSDKDDPSGAAATNFSVVRLKRNVLRRSNIGVLYTRRVETASGGQPAGETLGVDGLYSFSPALNVNAYYARTRKAGVAVDDSASHLFRFDYSGDRYGLQAEHLSVDKKFNPEAGFLRRTDFRRSFLLARFSPRPAKTHMKAVRRFIYQGSAEYFENSEGRVDMRDVDGQFQIELLNSDHVSVDYVHDYEFIQSKFRIASNVTVPVGGYDYQNGVFTYAFGTQHTLSGNLTYQQGSLYGGTKRTLALGSGRLEVTSQFAIEPSLSANWVDLPWGRFTSTVITDRNTYTVTPRMFFSALVQFNSSTHTLSTNARFRWEYRPGSEMFVVYSDGRDTAPRGFPTLVNHAFVVKINKLMRF
jgi:hypothetical protein